MNDAPLASLTTSNSVSEVKFRHNVMGVKMTEEIRKLAQFFMKPFPLDSNQRHVQRPSDQKYFATKSSAVIGGICKNATEILDKILLVNQLIDQMSKIYLVGEIGLAAVSVLLDTKVCKVEHNNLNYHDYSRFLAMLFKKAQDRGCELVLPVDFCAAPKINKAQTLDGNSQPTDRPLSRQQEDTTQLK